MAIPNENTSTA